MMSLKQSIETWCAALAAYDNHEFDASLKCFGQIADTSKIFFNLGVINATLGEHAKAVDYYQQAVHLDQYLAVAYFQQGVSNFLMGDFEEALANFNDTLLYLRGNYHIDYEQLGLKFKLYSCEVLFNRGLCYIYLQQKDAGMQDLVFAAREKRVPDHDVIDEAIREQAEGYTVFSIPVGVVYRPNEAKVRNLKTKDYLGKARLVAAQERTSHSDPRRLAAMARLAIDDRPEEKLSYAALNLVKPDLRSRSRQQSEPPLQRNIFPPTPPPELEHPDLLQSRARRKSNESTSSLTIGLQQSRPAAATPSRLDLGVAAFHQQVQTEKARAAPKRSESERPAPRRQFSDSSARLESSRQHEQVRRQLDLPEVRIHEDPVTPSDNDGANEGLLPIGLGHQRNKSNVTTGTRSQPTISEEDEDDVDDYDDISDPSAAPPPLAFEIIPPRPPHRRQPSKRVPDFRKVRIKVHAEDTRYIMTVPSVTFAQLAEQIRVKFGLRGGFKLKVKDEDGDSITMGDDDDLEMAMGFCRAGAARERSEMGKMEIWVVEV
ncbi:putative PB1 domain protein [Neohortaea acidophila]|uniref:Putative PB1 domain protein n=1 Tax=Neohortaea acidophila TaxID=245834 RepID=A0A6A6Q793_9PEZI|nr:putative PB1 domain protein [Neohortaea acidophila]KAF2487864.1 putative PB1 domain protein [Neohortaea acidophila]